MKNFGINLTDEISEEENKLIIGENYEALKNLLLTHEEKIDVIYIDPPYNTESAKNDGNQSSKEGKSSKFIYKDKFGRNGWLNMMRERLILAKKLLRSDGGGAIFVSIDDSEQAYLKILMDEIFGEENFICNFIWQKKNSGSAADSTFIKKLTEYVLFYTKDVSKFSINSYLEDLDNGGYLLKDEYFSKRGKYKLKQLDMASLTWSKGLDYPIVVNSQEYYAGGNIEAYIKRSQGIHAEKDWQWRWSKNKFDEYIQKGFIEIKNGKVFSKQYQFVDNNDEEFERTSKYTNLIFNDSNNLKNINGSYGTGELKDIFNNNKVFDHPKPINLIKFLINLITIKNRTLTVLDFFAGSGTTGHAVMELNRQDQVNRKFILVTNNENDIAIKTTYERLYRIINGKSSNNQENDFKWLKNNKPFVNNKLRVFNIKHYNVETSQIEKVDSITTEAINNLQKLSPSYKPNKLDIYYDLDGLNPYDDSQLEQEYSTDPLFRKEI